MSRWEAPPDIESYVIEVLREHNNSLEAELQNLQGSAQFRLSSLILNGLFPLGPNTLRTCLKLFSIYRTRARAGASKARVGVDADALRFSSASTIVFGTAMPESMENQQSVWLTGDEAALVARLDQGAGGGVLVVRVPSQAILRRLERIRTEGWHTVWFPESSGQASPALVAYASSHCDEVREASVE
jgi:hypothetical protein